MVTSILGAIAKIGAVVAKALVSGTKAILKAGTAIKTFASSTAGALAAKGVPTLIVKAVSSLPKVLATGILLGKHVADNSLNKNVGTSVLNHAVIQPVADIAILSLI